MEFHLRKAIYVLYLLWLPVSYIVIAVLSLLLAIILQTIGVTFSIQAFYMLLVVLNIMILLKLIKSKIVITSNTITFYSLLNNKEVKRTDIESVEYKKIPSWKTSNGKLGFRSATVYKWTNARQKYLVLKLKNKKVITKEITNFENNDQIVKLLKRK